MTEDRLQDYHHQQGKEVNHRRTFLRQAGRVDHELLQVGGVSVEADRSPEGHPNDDQDLLGVLSQQPKGAGLLVFLVGAVELIRFFH